MQYKIGKSSKNNFKEAVEEAADGLLTPKLILFFSDLKNFEGYNNEILEKFKESIIIGSTSFAAYCKDGAYKDGLILIGIEDGIECYGDVLEDADRYPIKYVDRVSNCINKLSNTENTVCFEITSALRSCEELVLSTLNSVIEDKRIPLFGGSSGDYGRAENTKLSFNGKIYNNACAFVFIKNLGGKIKLYRENIYKPTEHYFTATKVDVKNRIVYEYDNKPAAKVTAEALNTSVDRLQEYLDSYPLGRIIGNEMYITANQMVTENNGMAYHARVYNNSKMVLLEPDNYRKVISETLSSIKREIPKPSLSIMINCLARSMLFEKDGYLNSFGKEVGSVLGDYIGFAGYGEQLNQQHFNQTMVLAIFE